MKKDRPELRLLTTPTAQLQVSGATLVDVARVAGVSPITVSRALHQPHLVRPNTLAKVQAAVQETGYMKNMQNMPPGGLASSRSKLVALAMVCLLYTSPSPRDGLLSRMPSSA